MNKEIIIALNKTKMIFIFLGALAFLGIGIWFAISPETFSDEGESVGFVKFMGIITALFAGLGIFGIGKKIFDPNPGLIIGKEGIMDNSSAVAVGLIKWEDIIGFSILEVSGQKIILPRVNNPQDYIDRQESTIKKKMMSMNNKLYKTPLSINTNSLKYKTDDLLDLLESKLSER